jgi:hypothetical protein
LYLFVDSTRETVDKNIELIVSLTSLSRWYDSGPSDGGGSIGPTMATISEKAGRGAGTSFDKTATDVSPARGLGGKQRTSNVEINSQTPGPNVGAHDGNTAESKKKAI